MIRILPQRFPLGKLRITRRAQALLDLTGESAWPYLFRHGARPEGAEEEESDGPVVSTFTTASGRQIVVRTTADRSQTLILLPEECQ
jgi:hypothetical protein